MQDAWLEVAVVRTAVAKGVTGGVSGLAKHIVGLFDEDSAHNMATAGITVGRPGAAMHLFLRVSGVLADEGAIHALYSCKGAGGLKPCLLCRNVFDAKTVRDVVGRGDAVLHTCADSTKLRPITSAVLGAIFRSLAAIAAMPRSKGKLEEEETRLVWTLNPGSLLQSGQAFLDKFHPGETCIWDAMHVLFVNGVVNTHVGQLMVVAKGYGVTYEAMDRAASTFAFPAIGRKGLKPSDGKVVGAFTTKRAESHWEAVSFKCTASEGLGLMPWIKYFMLAAASALPNDFSVHVQCFVQLAGIVEAIFEAHRTPVNAGALQRAVEMYLGEFERLYGTDPMIPKFHYAVASLALPPIPAALRCSSAGCCMPHCDPRR